MKKRSHFKWGGSLVAILLVVGNAIGQSTYSPSDEAKIGRSARELLSDKFLDNLDLMTHYPAHQPIEAINDQIAATIRDAFSSPGVLIFNEFRVGSNPRTTLREYVNDCRIQSNGQPLRHTLALDTARYSFGRTPSGQPYLNVYAVKLLTGQPKAKRPIHFQNLIEFRVAFSQDVRQGLFYAFRLEGIEKVTTWPAQARRLPNEPVVNRIDLNTVAAALVGQLATSLPVGTWRVALESFTYNGCGITNALSDRVYAAINVQFPTRTGAIVVSGTDDARALRLRGFYAENLNNLRVDAELYDPVTKRALARTANTQLPLGWLSENGLDLIPEDIGRVQPTNDTLRISAELLPPVPGLQLEIRTDRGREGAEYWEGDTLRLLVKSNRPCYLRLMNLQANGTRVVLEENLEIKAGQEGRYLPIGGEYTCAAPFGTEHLLVYASPTPLCPLPKTPRPGGYVRREDGYDVFVGSLPDLIRLSACTTDGTVAQDRIQLTTRAKRKERK